MRDRLKEFFMKHGDARHSTCYIYNFKVTEEQAPELKEILDALDIVHQQHSRYDGALTISAKVGGPILCLT